MADEKKLASQEQGSKDLAKLEHTELEETRISNESREIALSLLISDQPADQNPSTTEETRISRKTREMALLMKEESQDQNSESATQISDQKQEPATILPDLEVEEPIGFDDDLSPISETAQKALSSFALPSCDLRPEPLHDESTEKEDIQEAHVSLGEKILEPKQVNPQEPSQKNSLESNDPWKKIVTNENMTPPNTLNQNSGASAKAKASTIDTALLPSQDVAPLSKTAPPPITPLSEKDQTPNLEQVASSDSDATEYVDDDPTFHDIDTEEKIAEIAQITGDAPSINEHAAERSVEGSSTVDKNSNLSAVELDRLNDDAPTISEFDPEEAGAQPSGGFPLDSHQKVQSISILFFLGMFLFIGIASLIIWFLIHNL